jgi:cytochrome c2
MTWKGIPYHTKARQGKAMQGKELHGKERARQCKACHGMSSQGKAIQGKEWNGKERQCARQGKAWQWQGNMARKYKDKYNNP